MPGPEQTLKQSINPIQELQKARSSILLVWILHTKTQGPKTVTKKMLEAMTNAVQNRRLKTYRECLSSPTSMPGQMPATCAMHSLLPMAKVKQQDKNETTTACLCHSGTAENMAPTSDQSLQMPNCFRSCSQGTRIGVLLMAEPSTMIRLLTVAGSQP